MDLTNEWIEQGKIEGRVEGRVEGRRDLVRLQLGRRFGTLPGDLGEEIARLSMSQIDELGQAIFDFKDLDDARLWLSQRLNG